MIDNKLVALAERRKHLKVVRSRRYSADLTLGSPFLPAHHALHMRPAGPKIM